MQKPAKKTEEINLDEIDPASFGKPVADETDQLDLEESEEEEEPPKNNNSKTETKRKTKNFSEQELTDIQDCVNKFLSQYIRSLDPNYKHHIKHPEFSQVIQKYHRVEKIRDKITKMLNPTKEKVKETKKID
jgi:hypothetical protein